MTLGPKAVAHNVCRLAGLALLSFATTLGQDEVMPKVNPPATNMKKFEDLLRDDFPQRFDGWRAGIENTERGILEITHEEIIA